MTEREICNDLLKYIKDNSNAYEILLRYFNNYRDDNQEDFMRNVPGIILNMTFKYYREKNIEIKNIDINSELELCFREVLAHEFHNWKARS